MSGISTGQPFETAPQSAASTPSWAWQVGYLFGNGIQLLGLGLVLDFLIFGGANLWLLVRLGVLGLLLRALSSGGAWAVFLAALISLFLRENPMIFRGLSATMVIYCLCTFCIMLYALRVKSIQHQISQSVADMVEWAVRVGNQGIRHESRRNSAMRELVQVVRAAAAFLAVLICSGMVLAYLPASLANRRWWLAWTVENQHVFWPILLFAVAAFILLSETAWRQLSPRQAGVFLRSGFVTEYGREFRSFLRRRQKMEKGKKE